MRLAKHLLLCSLSFIFAVHIDAFAGENKNVSLIANVNDHASAGYNDVWGYSAPDGREYALLGVRNGTSINDVTDVNNVREIAFIEGPSFCTWYDLKTYQNYLYVVNDCGGGMQIIDLSSLPQSASVVKTFTGFDRSHNIFIDEEAGILYAEGNSLRPVLIYSLADPLNPVLLASAGVESHDQMAQDGVLYIAEGNHHSIGIYDVSNPASPSFITRLPIPDGGYAHNVWVSQDNNYMVTTEETTNKTVKLWDIHDLDNISLIDEYLGESKLAHNVFIKDSLVVMSHYLSGLKIVDIAAPSFMVEVGSYDTAPGSDAAGFSGAWGAYPFAKNGLIYVSDMSTGLYVIQYEGASVYRLTGIVKNGVSGAPIEDARIEVVDHDKQLRSNSSGLFRFGDTQEGDLTFQAAAFGFQPAEITVHAVPGTKDTVEISLQPLARSSIEGIVSDGSGEPIENITAHLVINSTLLDEPRELVEVTDAQGQFTFADLPISQGESVSYDTLRLDPVFPFAPFGLGEIVVEETAPTQLNLEMQPADILLVNDDPLGKYGEFYKNALQALNVTYHEWTTVAMGSAVPVDQMNELNNDIIIWYTGNAQGDVLNQNERTRLESFLDNGGKLFLTGQNVAQSLSEQGSPFLSERLGVEFQDNTTTFIVNGVQTNPVGQGLNIISTQAGDGANNQTSRDILIPLETSVAQAAFTYFQSEDVAGVTLSDATNGSKLVFLGFGFEAIVSTGQTAPRSQVLQNILNYFDVATGVKSPATDNVPKTFSLEQNYPNPFNPSTTLSYSLAQQSQVSLAVYNLLGQKVRHLVNGVQAAGRHQVLWDGKDDSGRLLPSGIYIYRIEAGQLHQTKRMLLLK